MPVTVTPLPPVVGVPGSTVAVQPLVIVVATSAGQEIVGPEVVTTLTVKLHEPPPVVEVEETTVEPTGKKEPEAWLVLMEPQFPKGSAAPKVTKAPGCPLSVALAVTVMSFGHSSVHSVAVAVPSTVVSASEVLSEGRGSVVELVTLAVSATTV